MTTSKQKKQTIELTKKQFKALLKAVYLGNWVANANRTDDKIQDYEAIEDYIFSLASLFGFERYMDHEKTDGDKHYPTGYFENETDVEELQDEYDNETFWEELADRLGERDFFEKYSEEEIEKMSEIEWFEKLHECIHVYHEEFEAFGLERINIKERNYDKYN